MQRWIQQSPSYIVIVVEQTKPQADDQGTTTCAIKNVGQQLSCGFRRRNPGLRGTPG